MLALFLRLKQVDITTVRLARQISYFKPADKGNLELNTLACLINYDIKGGHSNKGKGKGRGSNCSL